MDGSCSRARRRAFAAGATCCVPATSARPPSRRPPDHHGVRRDMRVTKNWIGVLAASAACALFVAACGGDDSSSNASKSDSPAAATSTPDASAALGTENKATGSPITVGLLNLESGPVTFPEYRQAAETAIKYINDYKSGI